VTRPDRRSGAERRAGTAFHLTPRERQVLERVLRGEQNKEIALGLGVAEQLVKGWVSELLRPNFKPGGNLFSAPEAA
jgi:FixJ family two-component response regulator